MLLSYLHKNVYSIFDYMNQFCFEIFQSILFCFVLSDIDKALNIKQV